MKKVLIVTDRLIMGGIEKILINILKNMDNERYNVTLYLPVPGGDLENELPKNVKVRYIYQKDPRGNKFGKLLYYFTQNMLPGWINKNFIVNEEYDIAIAYKASMIRYLNGLNCEKICYIHLSLDDIKNYYQKINFRKQLKSMNKIICVSEGIKRNVIDFLGEKENVMVRYNPVNAQEIEYKSRELINDIERTNIFQMVSVGRLDKIKGFDRMIDVCKMLVDSGLEFKLWIIGEGEEKKDLEKKIKDLSLEDTVLLLGQKENPYKYVKAADLFIYTSFSEGYCTVLTEALILKKPVISTNVTGTDEPLDYGNFGMLVDNNKESIYKGIREILTTEELYEELLTKARRASKSISLEKRIKEFEDLINN